MAMSMSASTSIPLTMRWNVGMVPGVSVSGDVLEVEGCIPATPAGTMGGTDPTPGTLTTRVGWVVVVVEC